MTMPMGCSPHDGAGDQADDEPDDDHDDDAHARAPCVRKRLRCVPIIPRAAFMGCNNTYARRARNMLHRDGRRRVYDVMSMSWRMSRVSASMLSVSEAQPRAALVVENVHASAVRHIVDLGVVAGLGLFDLVGDAVAARQVGDLLFVAGHADGVLVERVHIGLQDVGRIAMRIHADEHDAHVARLVAQVLQHGGQLGHGGGADVRAAGVAEEQQHGLALQVVVADGLAARAGQRELQVGQVALTSYRVQFMFRPPQAASRMNRVSSRRARPQVRCLMYPKAGRER